MSLVPESEWMNGLLAFLQAAQLGVLKLLQLAGLLGDLHGQAAWPWGQRLSGEPLLAEPAQARRLLASGLMAALALVLAVLALAWRRWRWVSAGGATLLLALAPWPDAHVVLVPAHPTSFHVSPSGFQAAGIVRGQALYARHCASCHAGDGTGEVARAASLPVWPPDLTGPLLWRRADGDLFWRVLHGVNDRRGRPTMPGFRGVLSDADAWALIDYMKALGAGQTLKQGGYWARPVAVPDFGVQCDGKPAQRVAGWQGQRLRLVAQPAGVPLPMEDPRLVTVRVTPSGTPAGEGCAATSADAWKALAVIVGTPPERLTGVQLIADRQGWARARGEPGKSSWSDSDLLCRTETGPRVAGVAPAADGLGALISRMDAEPVRFVKGGLVH